MQTGNDILKYNQSQEGDYKVTCEILAEEISAILSDSECKVWHAHPVWFLNGNPIVGYSRRKEGINLMFWSGQSFEEPKLTPEGSFKAAEIKYNSPSEIDINELKRWLEKSKKIQWDYKNIVKNKGKLDRLN